MWHELLAAGTEQVPTTGSLGQVTSLIVAIAGLVGAIGAIITLLVTRTKPKAVQPPEPVVDPLNSDSVDDDGDLTDDEKQIKAYRTMLIRLKVNPDKVLTGDEAMTRVRFE